MAAVEIDTSSYITGAGRSVVLIGSTYYCCFTKGTKLYMAHSASPGGPWTVFTGTAPTAVSGSAATIWSDGTSWYVAWYESTTKVYYATGSTTAYPAGTSIYTITAPGYYHIAGCADASGIPHIIFGNGDNPYYGNKVGGSWNSAVQIVSTNAGQSGMTIAIDTTSGHTARYNLPQVAWINQGTGVYYAGLGNVNNATSFTVVNPQSITGNYNYTSIAIDSNGVTNILATNASNYLVCVYLGASGTWGTASAWTAEVINSDAYNADGLSIAINGTARYAFRSDSNTGAVQYYVSTVYGTWGAANQLEATGYFPIARWQYANNSYSSGMDYLYSAAGSGQAGIYWDNLSLVTAFVLTDSGSGTDKILVGKALSLGDSGHGADTPLAGEGHILADSGSGVDVILRGKVILLTDTATGADLVYRGKAVVLAEVGTGTDQVLRGKLIILTDTATGVDLILRGKAVALTDTGTGVDVLLIGKNLQFSDSGAGVDAATRGAIVLITDVGSGADQALVGKTLILPDTGAGLDAVLRGKQIAIVDTAAGVDSILIGKVLTLADSAIGVDAILTGKSMGLVDAAVGEDLALIGKAFKLADFGSGLDILLGNKALNLSDSGVGEDSVQVTTGAETHIVLTDYGYGIDKVICITEINIIYVQPSRFIDRTLLNALQSTLPKIDRTLLNSMLSNSKIDKTILELYLSKYQ